MRISLLATAVSLALSLGCGGRGAHSPKVVEVDTASSTDDVAASSTDDAMVEVDMTAPLPSLVPPLELDLPASKVNRYGAEPVPVESREETPKAHEPTLPERSRGDLANVIRGRVDGLAQCYEIGRLSNPGMAGRIDVTWTVNPDGTVRDVRVASSELDDASTEACMVRSIESWRFPEASGAPTVITFPFRFRPVEP